MHDILGEKQTMLTADGWTMKRTGSNEHRESGLAALERHKKAHPDYSWEWRDYMACINRCKDGICTDWSKEEGWSIWFRFNVKGGE